MAGRDELKVTVMGGEVGEAAGASGTGSPWCTVPVPCPAQPAPFSTLPVESVKNQS